MSVCVPVVYIPDYNGDMVTRPTQPRRSDTSIGLGDFTVDHSDASSAAERNDKNPMLQYLKYTQHHAEQYIIIVDNQNKGSCRLETL